MDCLETMENKEWVFPMIGTAWLWKDAAKR